jgi:poly-gamma-glutamate capsule biosynthesis protein CapA/YwtB (metallophosphatase superfamily)
VEFSGNAYMTVHGRVTLSLCGDVMTGRGIDQILPHPSEPKIHETWVASAGEYVKLAEQAHGRIAKPVDFAYLWGDVLSEFERRRVDVRIINLETAVTTSDDAWLGKGIHYRMHPENVGCLTAAGVDCCVLANNHALDWGREGLTETLRVLHDAGLCTVGAGVDPGEACAPARLDTPRGVSVLLFACGATDSGVPIGWRAQAHWPGLCVLDECSVRTVHEIAARVSSHKQAGDVVVMSLHWGGNWGYPIADAHRRFAHELIDNAGVDVVYGHSSHHPKGIEIYRGKLILYGCGDFLNDYEGIAGYERFRGDLGLMYFPTLDVATGKLVRMELTPTRVHRMRVNRTTREEAHWLFERMSREGRRFGTGLRMESDDTMSLVWAH